MPEFNVRSDSVNVEQIMDQIRARIRDKRGVDYTEEQIRELAAVKLEKFLDPRGVRSDLLDQFRRSQPPPAPLTVPLYPFEDTTLFDSHRGFVRFFRRLFRPLLKLFFNSNALASSLHAQTVINRQTVDRLDGVENSLRQNGDLYYELLHNMVLELTRMTIEVKNAKMRVESIASRLEFNERRARALESVVVYKPAEDEREEPRVPAPPPRVNESQAPREQPRQPTPPPQMYNQPPATPPAPAGAASPGTPESPAAEGPGQRSRRRRRRRGRRGGASAVSMMTPSGSGESAAARDPGQGSTPNVQPPAERSSGGASEGDARHTRPEPFEHTFGSSAHPAEPRNDAPSSTPAPSPSSESSASESPDDDQ